MLMLSRIGSICLLCFPLMVASSGCFAPWFKSNPNLSVAGKRREAIRDKLQSEDRPTLISQIGSPAMLTNSRLENIGLVTQLYETGGKVNASQQREKILDVMRRNEAEQPNAILDSESTTMVVAHVDVGPAARAGEIVDARVTLSVHSNAVDLEHGFLMHTPLMEMSRLGGQVREGFERAVVRGPVVTMFQIHGDQASDAKLQGIVVGGGKLLKGRQLGISIASEFADAITMAAVVPAINRRFTYFNGRSQTGIATPREDQYVELAVPPRYRLDPFHFVNVVLQIGFNESEAQLDERKEELSRQLREPTTVRNACWQLEAIGEEALPLLAEALDDPDPEIRFYAAHSMAYLNDKRTIAPLTALCRQEPAFRAMCFNALIVLDHFEATEALRELLHAAQPEVRYGALLALREKDRTDPQVTGDQVPGAGSILEIPTSGPPLVASSLTKLPEIVVFGEQPILYIPDFHYVNKRILISSNKRGGYTVSYFNAGEEDRIVESQPDLRSVLEGIAEVGGTYGDWVRFVREIHEEGYLSEPYALNPIPMTGRVYQRAPEPKGEPGEEMVEQTIIAPEDPVDEDDSDISDWLWFNPFGWGD